MCKDSTSVPECACFKTMVWKKKERSVQMDNLKELLCTKRIDYMPNARVRELCEDKGMKGFM